MKKQAIFITIFLFIHHIVAILHGGVHTEIPVILSSAQNIFVTVVIMLLPIIAVSLIWLGLTSTKYANIGFLLLAISMGGSLIFDVYHHYILVSPDNISHLPDAPTNVHLQFIWTAHALALVQSFGTVLALYLWRKNTKKVHG